MIQKKICMVGSFGVGKTSLVARYVQGLFSEKYITTVGVKIDKKIVECDGAQVTLVLWDLAGEDALTTVRASHLRGASGYILVVDGSRRPTIDAAVDLQSRVSGLIGSVPFVCAINKADMRESWEVKQVDLDHLTDRGWKVMEASARTGTAVEDLFCALTNAMMQVKDVDGPRTCTS
jgi:small GTP-binding protein